MLIHLSFLTDELALYVETFDAEFIYESLDRDVGGYLSFLDICFAKWTVLLLPNTVHTEEVVTTRRFYSFV